MNRLVFFFFLFSFFVGAFDLSELDEEYRDDAKSLLIRDVEEIPEEIIGTEDEVFSRIGEEGLSVEEIEDVYLKAEYSKDFFDELKIVDKEYEEYLKIRMLYLLDYFSKEALLKYVELKESDALSEKSAQKALDCINNILGFRSKATDDFNKTRSRYPYTELARFQNNLRLFDQVVSKATNTQDSWWSNVRKQLLDFWRRRGVNARIFQLIATTRFSSQAPKGKTPIVKAIADAFQALGKKSGKSVVVEGIEHVKGAELGPDDLLLVLPEHAHPFNDNIAWSHIGLDPSETLFLSKTGGFFPNFMTEAFARSNNIVEVDRENPVKSTMAMVSNKEGGHGLSVGVIFPQGNISAGFYEVPPVARPFSGVLLKKLAKEKNIRIIPMSLPRNMSPLNELDTPDTKEIKVVLHPEIPPEKVEHFLTSKRN